MFFPVVQGVLPWSPAQVLPPSAGRERRVLSSAELPACFFWVEVAQPACSVVIRPHYHYRYRFPKLSWTKKARVTNEVKLVGSIPFLQPSSFLRPVPVPQVSVRQTQERVSATWFRGCALAVWIGIWSIALCNGMRGEWDTCAATSPPLGRNTGFLFGFLLPLATMARFIGRRGEESKMTNKII